MLCDYQIELGNTEDFLTAVFRGLEILGQPYMGGLDNPLETMLYLLPFIYNIKGTYTFPSINTLSGY